MSEVIEAGARKMPCGKWRAKVKFLGSYIEQDFDDPRIAWEFVLGWMPNRDRGQE